MASDADPVSSPSSSGSSKVPAIFLSHSGKQKPFVERLNVALLKVNHIAFFDKHSLPKGSFFPEHIMTAARKCTPGVVVLSDDFLMSKWPLLELEILVQQRGPHAKVLPVFYKLKPEDLKSPEKLAKWQEEWKKFARQPTDVAKWETTVKALRGLHGETFQQETSEGVYIKRVVKSICSVVPCPLPYDMSEIRGHHRVVEEVAGRFDLVHRAQQDEGVCMVGLHGVGGAGKSTMCKALANVFWPEYLGKSHHLELPTKGSNMELVVQECKKALEALADVDEKLLKKAGDIDQVIQLMKQHLAQHDVFLAIDNVWESSREAAERILKVGFSSKSKIVVTSRSEEVLKDLFLDQNNSDVGPLPAPEHEEAFQIFQDAFRLGNLNSLVREKHLVDGALKRCNFDGTYHALALRALGLHVKKACALRGLQHLSRILGEMKSVDLPKGVEAVIRCSYDSLEEHEKHMFLDIVVLQGIMQGDSDEFTVEKACQWLSFLYERQLPKGKDLNVTIYELGLGGLLQFETDGVTGEKIIKVHDLLSDLAESEAARSSRFFIAGRSSGAVEEIRWQELERVILPGFCDLPFIEKLQQQECRRLQVLVAARLEFSEGIDMCLMPALCVLMLCGVSLWGLRNWAASALAIIDLQYVISQQPFGSMPLIQHRGVMNREDVAGLQRPAMEGIEGLGTLKTLQSLRLEGCEPLEGIPDLSGLARLDSLTLWGNRSMEEMGGLSSSLRVVKIYFCGALRNVPDMHGLTRLEKLEICWCSSLRRIPDLSGLARLDTLVLEGNHSMEEVVGLSSSLRNVEIRECRALRKVPDMSGVTRLECLNLYGNEAMEEVEGESVSSTLKHLFIKACPRLRKLPEGCPRPVHDVSSPSTIQERAPM